jgi:molecular chaperone GrpE (heat shock protein)
MDPISAIAVATTAFNTIKKGFQVGRDVESMSKDLGRWMGAIQDVKEGHNNKKGRSFGSVEEESLETFAALKKAQQMEDELRTFVNMNYGPNAWNEVIRLQADIRLKKKKAFEEAEQKKKEVIENIIVSGAVIFFVAFVGYIVYILATFG